jgi:mRNA interferase MazF
LKRKEPNYLPDRGDLVWITLNPGAGHEQAGRRPAMVISPRSYNRKTGLCVLCPATRQAKGYAFEVEIANPDGTTSVVLADHLRNVDWKARDIQLIRRLPDAELSEVVARIDALLVSPDA